ncbi:MAG: peroxide stress protein YaaA [Verrucomicrobiota bacterium]|nr:peroxide stress protein YaaA [Verrucomicrobiota bacterium]
MILTLSPAKTMDFEAQCLTKKHTGPDFIEDSQELIQNLTKMGKSDLSLLMNISDKLANLNYDRYRSWSLPFSTNNAKQALLAFKGDVYTGFRFNEWRAADFNFAQKKIRILSGLYGLLRPLDLIQAYRLEMGTGLITSRGNNLYDFWGDKITDALNRVVKDTKSKILINLASNEYFKSVDANNLDAEIITPTFKDFKNGKYKFISFYAKKARGMMADFIVRNKIKSAAEILKFNFEGYYYCSSSSTPEDPVFLRD